MVKTFLTEDFIGKVTQLSANQELVGFDAISDSIPGAEQLIGEVMAKGEYSISKLVYNLIISHANVLYKQSNSYRHTDFCIY